MLKVEHYVGPSRGKARGNWEFWARNSAGAWRITCKGRKVVRRYWYQDMGDSNALFYSPFSIMPAAPEVSAELLAYARAQLVGA